MRILVLTLMMSFLSHSTFGAQDQPPSTLQRIKSKTWDLHQFLAAPFVAYVEKNYCHEIIIERHKENFFMNMERVTLDSVKKWKERYKRLESNVFGTYDDVRKATEMADEDSIELAKKASRFAYQVGQASIAFIESLRVFEQHSLYRPDETPIELWVAYVSDRPGNDPNFKYENIEMAVTVLTSAEAEFYSPIGISRWLGFEQRHRGIIGNISKWLGIESAQRHRGISMGLHRFVADKICKIHPNIKYMATSPLKSMLDILNKSIGGHFYQFDQFDQIGHRNSDGTECESCQRFFDSNQITKDGSYLKGMRAFFNLNQPMYSFYQKHGEFHGGEYKIIVPVELLKGKDHTDYTPDFN